MRKATIFLSTAIKLVLIDFLIDLIYFPVWYFSTGFLKFVNFFIDNIKQMEYSLAISVWAKNILVPMYGQFDFTGRVISFFIRLFQIFFRSLFLFVYAIIALMVVFVYLMLPFMILFFIFVNLGLINL